MLYRVVQGFPGELRIRADKLHGDIVRISHIIHTLARELHDARLTFIGLVAAARGLCRDVGERHSIEVDFEHDSFPESVPSEASLCIFRVLQHLSMDSGAVLGF